MQQDRAFDLLPVCAIEALGEPDDDEPDFNSIRRCSICSLVKRLASASLAVGKLHPVFSPALLFQFTGFLCSLQ